MTSKVFEISLYSMILSSIGLAICSVIYCWRPFNPRYMRSFPIYTVVNAGENLVTLLIRWLIVPAQSIFTLFEMLYFSYFLATIIARKKSRYLIWVSALGFTVFYLYLMARELAMIEAPLLAVIEAFLLCAGCLLYFREMMMQPQLTNLARTPSFWMTMGILFYFSLLVPTMFFSGYYQVRKEHDRSLTVYSINNYAQVINAALFIKGMTCLKKPSSRS